MCADLFREVLGRALGGREPAKTLLLRSRFGGAALGRVWARHGDSNTRNAPQAATSTENKGPVFWIGKNKGAWSPCFQFIPVWENQTQTLSCFC